MKRDCSPSLFRRLVRITFYPRLKMHSVFETNFLKPVSYKRKKPFDMFEYDFVVKN